MRYDERTIRVPDEVHEAVLRALGQIESMSAETGGREDVRHESAKHPVRSERGESVKSRRPGMPEDRRFAKVGAEVLPMWVKTARTAAILFFCITAISITSVAAVNFVRARMEAMDKTQKEAYWEQVYRNRMGRDTTSRPLTRDELERMEKLAVSYEAGVFPEGEIRVIETVDAYDGTGIAYLRETGTFYLPETEMTDEELLQILDFRAKRDYSLSAINEELEQTGTEAAEIIQQSCSWDIPADIVPYEGEGISALCAGKDCVWLGGQGYILRLEVGCSSAEIFCDGLDENCEVRAICERADGSLLAASWDRETEGCRNRLWMIDASGNVNQSIELAYINGFVSKIAVDKNGYIYLKGGAGTMLGISVLDADGQLVAKPECEGYRSDFWWAYCVTDQGEIQLLSKETTSGRMDILTIDPATWETRVVLQDVYPGDNYVPDVMMKDGDRYLFWGYDGLWQYDIPAKAYRQIRRPEDYPVTYDGIKSCVAADGSLCLYFWWDGKGFCFDYENIVEAE